LIRCNDSKVATAKLRTTLCARSQTPLDGLTVCALKVGGRPISVTPHFPSISANARRRINEVDQFQVDPHLVSFVTNVFRAANTEASFSIETPTNDLICHSDGTGMGTSGRKKFDVSGVTVKVDSW